MFKRGSVWWTCIKYNGRKIQKSLDTTDKRLAQAIESKIRTAIVEDTYFENSVGVNKTFTDMVEKFMKEHAPKVSVNMQNSYKSSLKHLIPFFRLSKIVSISPKMISRYKVSRDNEGAKPATINRELAMLSKAFNLAVKEWEWVKENPLTKVPKEKENNERDRWLTEVEEKRLLNYCPEWLSDIIIFDLNTGLRQDELLSLEWSRVNLIQKTIIIQKTKSGKPRTIPLNETAIDILVRKSTIRSIKGIVFANGNGNKINRHNLRRAFNNAARKAELENLRFHDLRHTFATRMAQNGVDIYKIAKLLGHETLKMTQRYAHHCSESLRDGVEILKRKVNGIVD